MHGLHFPRSGFLAWLAFVLALGAPHALAAPATYTGSAAVGSQSEAERTEALKSALADVVMRLSGDPGALARADVARAVAEGTGYVLQYQYQREVVAAADGTPQVRLTLVAEFDAAAVDRLLDRVGLGGGAPLAVDSTPSEHRVWISGVHSALDYARALGYLTRHPLVRDAQPDEARGDGLRVRLVVLGGIDRLLGVLAADGTLSVTNAAPPVEGIDATLALVP